MFLLFLQKLQAREKDLESSRKETEKKLAEANFETQQVCSAHRILSVSDEKKTWKWKNAFLNPEDSTLEPIMRQVAKNLFDLKQKSTRIICLIIHNDSLRAYSCYNCIKFALLVAAFFFFFLFFSFSFFFSFPFFSQPLVVRTQNGWVSRLWIKFASAFISQVYYKFDFNFSAGFGEST